MILFPHVLVYSFIALVAFLYFALVMGVLYADNQVERDSRWTVRMLRFAVGGFLLITGLLALDNTFRNFNEIPPPIMFVIVPAFIGMLALSFNPLMKRWLKFIPQWALIGIQSFRIFIEIQLALLAKTLYFPTEMTMRGRNFDIVTGITALFVAVYIYKKGASKKLIIGWNILGLVLLTNVFVIGMLSTPTPFQVIFSQPPNTAIAYFPFIWLPTFVVPFAYMLHILSLRKALSEI